MGYFIFLLFFFFFIFCLSRSLDLCSLICRAYWICVCACLFAMYRVGVGCPESFLCSYVQWYLLLHFSKFYGGIAAYSSLCLYGTLNFFFFKISQSLFIWFI